MKVLVIQPKIGMGDMVIYLPYIHAISKKNNVKVSILVKDRQGYDLLPELGYKPTNKYLPPRPRRDQFSKGQEQISILDMANSDVSDELNETNNPLLKWVDAVLSR